MDRDFLLDLFAAFGPVTLRRMFSGFGISADEVNFALALRSGVYLRADDHTIAKFEAEGCKPFQYATRARTVTVRSYWQLPERLYDDPDELAERGGGATFGVSERGTDRGRDLGEDRRQDSPGVLEGGHDRREAVAQFGHVLEQGLRPRDVGGSVVVVTSQDGEELGGEGSDLEQDVADLEGGGDDG